MRSASHWEDRFRAPRWTLPDWARDRPERCVLRGNVGGVWEVYAWDATAGAPPRRVTARPNGTHLGAIEPSGRHVWWFADTDGDEFGVWMRQPFGGGAEAPVSPRLSAGYPAGLGIGRTLAAVGTSDDDGSTIWVVSLDGSAPPRVLYRHEQDASVVGLSADESLVVVEHSEHGDSRHPALRAYTVDGEVVADLWDGPGRGLSGIGFPDLTGDRRMLVGHERRGRDELLLWELADGSARELAVDLPGELDGDWFPDGRAVLVRHDHRGRAELHRLDLQSGVLAALGSPPGLVGSATARPDGAVWFSWSSAAERPQVRDLRGAEVLPPPGPLPPPSVPVEDVAVGSVHALLSRPRGSAAPYRTVFVVHGGPTAHDTDSWRPDVAAWVDARYAVVQVNYRGSTGYGSAWRDAIEAAPGLTELADLRAVRDHLVEAGVARPDAVALTGASWGGFLTLLGLGVQPDAWAVGVAEVPVADYLAAYEDEMEQLKAFDRSLFGGSPAEVPESYRRSSPLTYVDAVRAPVFITAGENDPRCPLRQIENYLTALREREAVHEVYRYDAGHGSLVVEEQVKQQRLAMEFVERHLPA